MHIQFAVDERIFVIYGVPSGSCEVCYPHTYMYSSKKLFEFVQISRPTQAEIGWARAHCPPVPLHGYATVTGEVSFVTVNLFSSYASMKFSA